MDRIYHRMSVGMDHVGFLLVFGLFVATVQSNEGCGVFKDVNNLPWKVGIYAENTTSHLELICIGTAIKPGFVVTAAHCLCDHSGRVKGDNFYVASGKLEKNLGTNDKKDMQKVEKQKIFINGNFEGVSTGFMGDIAVVKLQKHLNYDGFTPICIDWDNTTPNLANEFKLKSSVFQREGIKVADVSYVDPELCQSIASNSFVGLLTSDQICAKLDDGVLPEDIDDGGSLMFLNIIDNLWYIRGVVSGHDPENKKLVFYSNINIYLNWISSICAGP